VVAPRPSKPRLPLEAAESTMNSSCSRHVGSIETSAAAGSSRVLEPPNNWGTCPRHNRLHDQSEWRPPNWLAQWQVPAPHALQVRRGFSNDTSQPKLNLHVGCNALQLIPRGTLHRPPRALPTKGSHSEPRLTYLCAAKRNSKAVSS